MVLLQSDISSSYTWQIHGNHATRRQLKSEQSTLPQRMSHVTWPRRAHLGYYCIIT
jgi:hypothetical protein